MSDKHFTRFIEILHCLSQDNQLAKTFIDHSLTGDWSDFRECHISGDLLLIYQVETFARKHLARCDFIG